MSKVAVRPKKTGRQSHFEEFSLKSPRSTTARKTLVNTSVSNRVLELRQKLGLSQGEMASLMHLSARTLQRLESGETRLEDGELARYRELKNLADELLDVIPGTKLKSWLKEPLEEFGDRSTFEALVAGEIGKVWRMIYYLQSGTPG
ncbi:MAG: helix-turn-helix domain-containing protein [Candidatus Sumerlaeaceae bacterium]|nr:helix-turn-helix domain-containing protein [Candidatus Sumerlaeaceae bacterium]